MDVFLIPAGNNRYELYCEVGEEPETPVEQARRGWRRRLGDRFSAILASVEAQRHGAAHRRAMKAERPLGRRLRDRAVCWAAEKIAEQRLLWHLRGKHEVTLWFPDDLAPQEASDRVRAMLRADADRHTRWLVVDGAGLIVSLALVPIPGPNLILYYFIFRAGGHYLSRLGARHGLNRVAWQLQPSPPLTQLRAAAALDPDLRRRHVTEIASRLRLQHLVAFFERIAVPTS